jgi:hypothetical protein
LLTQIIVSGLFGYCPDVKALKSCSAQQLSILHMEREGLVQDLLRRLSTNKTIFEKQVEKKKRE